MELGLILPLHGSLPLYFVIHVLCIIVLTFLANKLSLSPWHDFRLPATHVTRRFHGYQYSQYSPCSSMQPTDNMLHNIETHPNCPAYLLMYLTTLHQGWHLDVQWWIDDRCNQLRHSWLDDVTTLKTCCRLL